MMFYFSYLKPQESVQLHGLNAYLHLPAQQHHLKQVTQ